MTARAKCLGLLGVLVAVASLMPATLKATRMTTDCSSCPYYTTGIQVYDDHWFSFSGGGFDPLGYVTADASSATHIRVVDVNGGDLEDGDTVALYIHSALHGDWFVSTSNGSTPLSWATPYIYALSDDELFTVETQDCDNCSLSGGGRFSLRSVSTGYYLTAVSGGGGNVDGTASSAGIYEIFELSVF